MLGTTPARPNRQSASSIFTSVESYSAGICTLIERSQDPRVQKKIESIHVVVSRLVRSRSHQSEPACGPLPIRSPTRAPSIVVPWAIRETMCPEKTGPPPSPSKCVFGEKIGRKIRLDVPPDKASAFIHSDRMSGRHLLGVLASENRPRSTTGCGRQPPSCSPSSCPIG